MDLKQLAIVLAASFALVAVLLLASAAMQGTAVKPLAANCVGVVLVQGEISTGGAGSLGGEGAQSGEVITELEGAEGDGRVSAIFLEINSPGGSAVASKEIFDAVREVKTKPVIAYISEAGASGGYYVASAAETIVANPNAITGSIGARATLLNYGGLFGKVGLYEESLKSGELKDMGAGSRNMTDKEREIFSRMVNETFENFELDVRDARKGKLTAAFEGVLDGRILTAKGALAAGLVDEIGTRKMALKKAAQLGGIPEGDGGKIEECTFARPSGLRELFSSLGSTAANAIIPALGLPSPGAPKIRLDYS
ncbi:MAG: signal peptide peptidase SppA [Candidatus Micrarchaeia archaeon]|jgi:protease-4